MAFLLNLNVCDRLLRAVQKGMPTCYTVVHAMDDVTSCCWEPENAIVVIVELRTDYFLYLWFLLCNIVMSLCI